MDIHLTVLFVSFDRVALRWEPSEDFPGVATFEVLRSGNAATGFEAVGKTESVVFMDDPNLMSKFKPTYYRIRAKVGTQVIESNVASITAPPGDDVLRLQARERFKLAKNDGIPAFLYTRRRSGKRCTRCIADKKTGDMGIVCEVCFGTGFLGGYYPPLPIYVASQTLAQEGTNLQENFVKENSQSNLWTSNWSIVNPEDVLIEMTPPNLVWRVTGVQRSERRRSAIRQLLTVSQADKGTAIYHLPIPDFPWPARDEIFYRDWSDEVGDFDTLFKRRVDAYVRDYQELRNPDEPPAKPRANPDAGGGRNPASGGVYS